MKKSKKILKTVFRILLLALCGGILGFNIYSANAKSLNGNALPMPFGIGASVVLSGSMEPALSVGDLILVKASDSYEKGDMVVFQDGRSLVVHRVIEEGDGKVVTKGDANNADDGAVELSQIKGEVFLAVPYVGTLIGFMKSPVGSLIIIAAAILLMELPRLKEKQKDADELEKIKEEIRKLKDEK